MLRFTTNVFRFTLLTVVLSSFLAGCSWFRSRPEYQGVEISKPLAIPADLSKPKNRDALQIPSKTLLGENARSPEQVANFMLNEESGKVWTRLGVALDGIEGVEVLNKAESIKSYEVRYKGEIFLISAQANGDKTRVVAIGVDGTVQQSAVSSELLAKLKTILSK
jgi:uncharacterized lipoprotein